MIISAHQPVYLPGIILFNKIALSDAFVLLGDAQTVRTSWQTRNRIRDNGHDRALLLSVPIRKKGRLGQSIDETEIADATWRKKHLKSIYYAYKDRPFFGRYFGQLEELLGRDWPRLGVLNAAVIALVMEWLEIDTPVLHVRDHAIEGHKTDRLVSLCRAVGATGFLSNIGAAAYLEEDRFAVAGLEHRWQAFTHPVYDQGAVTFLPDLSVVDLVFNAGPAAGGIVRAAGSVSAARPAA